MAAVLFTYIVGGLAVALGVAYFLQEAVWNAKQAPRRRRIRQLEAEDAELDKRIAELDKRIEESLNAIYGTERGGIDGR